jgi:DNA anti-recombination protein RmuC
MSDLYELYFALPTITQVFVVAISALTALIVGPLYNNRTVVYGPTVLTMIGIFGCFLGIALGLMRFDTNNVHGSVPALVEGIKTAFWASVFGVAGALLIKVRLLVAGPPRLPAGGAVQEATIDDLATLLSRLHQSLAGKEDSTLLSQFKLFRQETRDGLTALKTSLDNYMEKIADSNSKALIEALKEVIRDFNTKISEQFGDNFKQLNAAVEKLVVWQDKYRQQMSEMIEMQTKTTANMSEAATRYDMLVTQAEVFSTVANNLSSLVKTLEMQRDQIGVSLDQLGNLLKAAGDNLPKIESKIIEMTKQIENGVRANNDQIAATIKMATQTLQSSHADMKKLLVEVVEGANKDVNTHIKQLSENTNKQVLALDKALSDELSKSITTLGQHLTALSRKFVEDYAPLTDKLQALVQTARRM